MSPQRKYFGNAAHLIVGERCRFHIATQIGKVLISTVGEYWPERSSREIIAKHGDPAWLAKNGHLKDDAFDHAYMLKFGYDTIGCNRKYETMAFKVGGECECGCGLPSIASSEIDFAGYNDAKAATKGHEAMCRKFEKAKRSSPKKRTSGPSSLRRPRQYKRGK